MIGDDDRSTWSGATASPRSRSALVGGFIVGLTSVGSGTFFGLTMLFVFPLRAHKVVGTDILHAAALLYVAGFGHFIAGNVDMHAVGWLLIGSIPGVLIGSHYSVRIPEACCGSRSPTCWRSAGSSSCRSRTSTSRSRSALSVARRSPLLVRDAAASACARRKKLLVPAGEIAAH